jgi:hypothetical protein
MISYVGSFVLGLIIEKLSNESFLAVVGNVVEDLVDDDQEDVNVVAAVGTIVEDLVDGDQEDANKWFKCDDGNVVKSSPLLLVTRILTKKMPLKQAGTTTLMILRAPILATYHYCFPASTSLALNVFHFLVLPLLSFYMLLA